MFRTNHLISWLARLGHSGYFFGRSLLAWPQSARDRRAWVDQVYYLGVLSLVVISVSAAFIGMVVTLQGFYTLTKFGAEAQLSQLLALSVLRELGPVVTGLLYAGRAGSSLTAEVGLMQINEQIPCLQVMGVNPYRRVIFPRLMAGLLVVPCLVAVFNVIALLGGYVVAVSWLSIDPGIFWSNMQAAVHFKQDVLPGILKGLIFASLIHWVAIYQGYFTEPSPQGIGRAATRTVVLSSVLILAFDFIFTSFMVGAGV